MGKGTKKGTEGQAGVDGSEEGRGGKKVQKGGKRLAGGRGGRGKETCIRRARKKRRIRGQE